MNTVAIIGAGMAGLCCAQRLQASGLAVTVFDKGRGPGGRLSTRRRHAHQYDHGAPFFTAHAPAFQRQVEDWIARGVLAPWTGAFGESTDGVITAVSTAATRYVGIPRMSALTRHLANELQDVRPSVRIATVQPSRELIDVDGRSWGHFDAVVVATPSAQAAPLLNAVPTLAAAAQHRRQHPCLAVMVTFSQGLSLGWDGVQWTDHPLSLACRNASKPSRPQVESWVLHASVAWSARNVERDPQVCAAELLSMFCAQFDIDERDVLECVGHRWRYAFTGAACTPAVLYDPTAKIGACGDWSHGPGVEGAWHSGRALACAIMGETP